MINFLINIIVFIITLIIITKITDTNLKIKDKKSLILLVPLVISSILTMYFNSKINNIFLISTLTNITIVTLYKTIFEKYRTNNNISFKNLLVYLFFGLSISFILETSLFNYRHYESLNYKEQTLSYIRLDEKIKNNSGILSVKEDGNYKIELLNINKKVHNIYIDLENDYSNYIPIKMNLLYTDEANATYVPTPSFSVTKNINRSLFQKIHTSGKSEKIALNVELKKSSSYLLNEIKINTTIPFEISIPHIAIITIIIFLYFIFRPKSQIYKLKLLKYKCTKVAIILFTVAEIIFCSTIFFSNLQHIRYDWIHHHQYQDLAQSLKEGKVSLDYPASDEFLKLSNPYDTNLRNNTKLKINSDFIWDTSFYKGKYYVYFGVVPVLTSYLPYHLITGRDLQNHHIVYVMVLLTVISFLYLMYQIIKRWFSKTSLGMFLLLSILLINSSGLLLLCRCHDLYSVPIVYSLFFVSLGLGLWISAYNKKNDNQNIVKLIAGSFCMALVAGCRPQFLIGSFFIFPIFLNYFIKDKKITKRKILEICALLIPYIVVAIPLMIYNYVRFGSVFDFGANYNLTTNDMTKRGFVLDRILPGLYYLLFAIPDIKPVFPFLNSQILQTTYIGVTIHEPLFGGFLVCNLICAITMFLPKLKELFENKEVYYLALLSTVFAYIIVIADTEMAGILNRYTCDFGWLFIMATSLILLTLNKKYGNKNIFIKVISILVFLSVVYSFGNALLDTTYNLQTANPGMFEQLKYLICFWL